MCVLYDGLFSGDFWESEILMDGQFGYMMDVYGDFGFYF